MVFIMLMIRMGIKLRLILELAYWVNMINKAILYVKMALKKMLEGIGLRN